MTAYIIRRLLQMIPLIFGVTFLTFALINLIPGSPVARLRDNPKIRPEAAIELERQLGLDKPWPERYVRWLGDLAQGDLGVSLYRTRSCCRSSPSLSPSSSLSHSASMPRCAIAPSSITSLL